MTPDTPEPNPQTPHIAEDDLVLFTLQLLPDDRMHHAKKHLEGCDRCRTGVAKLQGDLVAYSMTTGMQPPPPAARERLLRQVAKEPRISIPEPEPVAAMPQRASTERSSREAVFPTRRSRGLRIDAQEEDRDEAIERQDRRPARRAPWVLAGIGWTIAVAACFFAGLEFRQRQQIDSNVAQQQAHLDQATRRATHAENALATLTAPNAMQVALHPATTAKPTPGAKSATPAPPPPNALAAYLPDTGALVFIATRLQPAPAGKIYELWLQPADGRNPIPAGTFRPDARGAAGIVMPQLPTGVPARGFEVTVENGGGSATPTLPLLMTSS